MREQSAVILNAFARLLALLSTLAGLVGLSFAALAAPLILQKGGGGGSGGPSGGGSPSQGSTRPSFQVNEPQYAVFPAISFSGTEAKNLVIMEKKAKEARLASATGDVSGRLATDIDEERASGLTRWNSMDAMTTDGPRGGTLTGSSSPILAGFRGSYPASTVAGDGSKVRGPYRDIKIAGLSGFQTANRNAKNQTFSDLVLTISKDPTTAAAVGTDVIVGNIARPFVNAAGKVGEEMVRQVQCASQGQLAASGCGEATPWQDYWGTLMTGEGEAYTTGALALDALTIGAGPTIAGMTNDAALAVLKKVPEGLEGLAKSVAKGTERIRAGYAASGFADETGAILVREGERIGSTLGNEAKLAAGTVEGLNSIRKEAQDLLLQGRVEGVTFDGQVFRQGSWEIHPGNIKANHRYSRVGTGALYTGKNGDTVVAELRFYLGNDAAINPISKVTKVDKMLDLTNPSIRESLGVSLNDITGDSYAITQAIGDLARYKYNGIIAPSARLPGGVNIVFFNVPSWRP